MWGSQGHTNDPKQPFKNPKRNKNKGYDLDEITIEEVQHAFNQPDERTGKAVGNLEINEH